MFVLTLVGSFRWVQFLQIGDLQQFMVQFLLIHVIMLIRARIYVLISQLVDQLQEAAKVGPLEISRYVVAIRITRHFNLLTYYCICVQIANTQSVL